MHGNNVMFYEDTRYKNSNCDTLTGFLESGIMHASDFATLKRHNFICEYDIKLCCCIQYNYRISFIELVRSIHIHG